MNNARFYMAPDVCVQIDLRTARSLQEGGNGKIASLRQTILFGRGQRTPHFLPC